MKKVAFILSVCLLAVYGCVDRDFNLADMSGEVTIGGEELVVPLATLNPITMDKILAENEIIKSDENGDYIIKYSTYGEDPTKYENFSLGSVRLPAIRDISPVINPITFVTPSLPTAINLSAIGMTIPITYPTIGSAMNVDKINISKELGLGLPISGVGVLTDEMLAVIPGLAKVNLSYEDTTHFEAEVTILKEFKKIDFVEFGCDIHPYGAPVEFAVDMNGLTDINGGGELKLNIVLPEGYYLRDERGQDYPQATHNVVSKSITIAPKQRHIKFLAYLHKIDYSDRELSEGVLEIKDDIKYAISLNLDVAAGAYDMSARPKLTFNSAPEYKDVEIVVQAFEIPAVSSPISYSFNGLNNSIVIEKIAFSQAPMTLKVSGLEWFGVDVGIKVKLPSCIHLRSVFNATLEAGSENIITTSLRKLERGVILDVAYIDVVDKTSFKLENGQLVLNDTVETLLDLSALNGQKIMLSQITPKTPSVNIGINIAETQLYIDTDSSVVTTASSESFDFKLEDQLPKLVHTVDIPEQIVAINEVGIRNADDTSKPVAIELKVAANNGVFPVDKLDVDIAINIGKMLRPTQETMDSGLITKSDNGDYILVINEEWNTSDVITKRVEIEALHNLPKVVDGKITIEQSFPVTGSVAIKSGESIDLSEVNDAAVKVDMKIDDIKMTTFAGNIDIGLSAKAMEAELGDLAGLGVNVGAMTINPVLKVNIADNPSGVPFYANAKLKLLDAEGNQFSEIVTPMIPIAGTGATRIVLSTPKNESIYKKDGVVFVAMEELAKLLDSGIPAKIVVDMEVASNPDEESVIDLEKIEAGIQLGYQYEVLIPLAFEGVLNLSYENVMGGMNEVFAEVASTTNGLTINDVSLLAEIGTNIPFDIILSAELVNQAGTTDGIDAKLNIENCVIAGYTPEFGDKRVSNIMINFDLGPDGSFSSLKRVDGIRLKFTICNTEQEIASLNKGQHLEGKVKLRLRDGVSLDIFELLNNVAEEE